MKASDILSVTYPYLGFRHFTARKRAVTHTPARWGSLGHDTPSLFLSRIVFSFIRVTCCAYDPTATTCKWYLQPERNATHHCGDDIQDEDANDQGQKGGQREATYLTRLIREKEAVVIQAVNADHEQHLRKEPGHDATERGQWNRWPTETEVVKVRFALFALLFSDGEPFPLPGKLVPFAGRRYARKVCIERQTYGREEDLRRIGDECEYCSTVSIKKLCPELDGLRRYCSPFPASSPLNR